MTNLGYAQVRYPSAMDSDAVKKNGFHDQGILVVDINDDRIGWVERQMLMNIGEKLYGRRKK